MGSQSLHSLQGASALAQLLALNALLDAARAGEAGREEAAVVESTLHAMPCDDLIDLECDQHLQQCYAQLMDALERPPRLL